MKGTGSQADIYGIIPGDAMGTVPAASNLQWPMWQAPDRPKTHGDKAMFNYTRNTGGNTQEHAVIYGDNSFKNAWGLGKHIGGRSNTGGQPGLPDL